MSDGFGTNPKVDLFADTVTRVNTQTPSFHKFITTWGEDDDTLQFVLGELASITTWKWHAFYIGDTVRNTDVGAQFLIDSNRRVAHIGFTRDTAGKTYIYHAEINCSDSIPYIITIDTLGSEIGRISNLRIEATTLYKTVNGGTRWGLVYEKINGDVVHYNDLEMAGTILNKNIGAGHAPCIAAGMGFPAPADTFQKANKYYTTAWIGTCSADKVLSQYVDVRTGLRPDSTVYFITNDTLASSYISIATSSNKGNKTLTTWYDGSNIWYKILDSLAVAGPTWPAASPSISDMTLWTPTSSGSVDWVNTDRYNLYMPGGTTPEGHIQAVANDFYDFATNTYKVVVNVFSSITGTSRSFTIDSARHPDIVIGDDPFIPSTGDTPSYYAVVIYENLKTVNPGITVNGLRVHKPFNDTIFTIVDSIGPRSIQGSSNVSKCPHLDMVIDQSPSTFASPNLPVFIMTWSENNSGTWQVMYSANNITLFTSIATPILIPISIDDGENPDVAVIRNGTNGYVNLVYTDPISLLLKHARFNPFVGPIAIGIDTLDTAVTVSAPPRIEAYNKAARSGDIQWVAVAEVDNGSNYEIREYRQQGCSGLLPTNYSEIPVTNTTTQTTTVSNNPLFGNDGYSPCVAAGNGPNTDNDPTAIGNSNYTIGWWIENNEYNALRIESDSYVPADAGYAQINTNPVNSAVVSSGRCKIALANGSNDGGGMVAAWVADAIPGPVIVIKASDNFSFKPSRKDDSYPDILGMTESSTTKKGINNINQNRPFKVYPNPAKHSLYIIAEVHSTYMILDITGRKMQEGILTEQKINIESLSNGTYIIQVYNSNGTINHARFVKQ